MSSRTTDSTKSGLVFPVGRIARMLKEGKFSGKYSYRVTDNAAVFMTGAIESIIFDVIDGAIEKRKQRAPNQTFTAGQGYRITNRDIYLFVNDDEDQHMLFINNLGAEFSNSGVRGGILPMLLK